MYAHTNASIMYSPPTSSMLLSRIAQPVRVLLIMGVCIASFIGQCTTNDMVSQEAPLADV